MKGLPWMSETQFKAQIWRNAMWFTAWKDGKDGIPWPECWEKLAAKTNQELGHEWDKTMASQECHEAWKAGRHDPLVREAVASAKLAQKGGRP